MRAQPTGSEDGDTNNANATHCVNMTLGLTCRAHGSRGSHSITPSAGMEVLGAEPDEQSGRSDGASGLVVGQVDVSSENNGALFVMNTHLST